MHDEIDEKYALLLTTLPLFFFQLNSKSKILTLLHA